MSITAMKQALNALEPYARQIVDQGKDYEMVKCDPKVDTAITALRAAIAEAEKQEAWNPSDTSYRPGGLPQDFIEQAENQEPVADELIRSYIGAVVADKPDEAADATKRMVDYVFATPPAAPVKESLTTQPAAQRQWVGLTEAEINEWDYDTRDLVMDIEKLLKEKNHG